MSTKQATINDVKLNFKFIGIELGNASLE